MKDVFLVDADDTLLDFHGVSTKSVCFALESNGFTWQTHYEHVFRDVNDAFWSRLERKEITRDELLKERFPYLLQTLGLDDSLGEKVNETYLRYLAENPQYVDGAAAFLDELKKRGKVYIVTNGTAWIQRSRFSILGLDKKVDGVFVSQTVGYDKPSQKYVDFVINAIDGFEKSRAVWIGDSLYADVLAAKNAGITAVWYNPKNKPCSGEVIPDYTARGFSEILEILQKIDAKA